MNDNLLSQFLQAHNTLMITKIHIIEEGIPVHVTYLVKKGKSLLEYLKWTLGQVFLTPGGRVRSFKILLRGIKSFQFMLELKFQSESRL